MGKYPRIRSQYMSTLFLSWHESKSLNKLLKAQVEFSWKLGRKRYLRYLSLMKTQKLESERKAILIFILSYPARFPISSNKIDIMLLKFYRKNSYLQKLTIPNQTMTEVVPLDPLQRLVKIHIIQCKHVMSYGVAVPVNIFSSTFRPNLIKGLWIYVWRTFVMRLLTQVL